MEDAVRTSLTAWESFYVIIGSSAAALTGLQFVVIALVAESRVKSSSREIAAFGTPNVVHFCAALIISAVLSAPWRSLASVAVILDVLGVAGVAYSAIVVLRARRQKGYQPVLEDWIWHNILPFVGYVTLTAAGVLLVRSPADALMMVGAVTLLLVLIGIHNAWDTVTYLALERPADTP